VCEMAAAAAVYGITFLFVSVRARERQFLFTQVRNLMAGWRAPVASMPEGA